MTHPMSNELLQALNQIGEQVDDLNPPDLKGLALALQAERERVRREIAEVLRHMHQLRAEAVARFTQLLLCARQDMPLVHASYFDTIRQLKELRHD